MATCSKHDHHNRLYLQAAAYDFQISRRKIHYMIVIGCVLGTIRGTRSNLRIMPYRQDRWCWRMIWVCSSCGETAKSKRQKCPRCGSTLWKPGRTRELSEVAGPMKRISPRGLLLAQTGKQQPAQEPGIECGKCHRIIYRPEKQFDSEAFQKAKRAHYSLSPDCSQ